MSTTATQFQQPNLKLFLGLKSSKPFKSSSPTFPCFPTPNLVFSKKGLSEKNGWLVELGPKKAMFELTAFRDRTNGDEAIKTLEQEAFVDGSSEFRGGLVSNKLETILNRLSKWVMSGLFAGVILWRHDAEAVWITMGSVINTVLSVALKRIINQERPASALKSDPGMPSSHAQSIFFIVTVSILSVVEWLGINDATVAISGVALAFGSYLSWLRVSQQLHTLSQVVVGAVIGSVFSVFWCWSWNAFVLQAFDSSLWVRIIVISGAAAFCLGFLLYVYQNWLRDD